MTLHKTKGGYQILRDGKPINYGYEYPDKAGAKRLMETIEGFGW